MLHFRTVFLRVLRYLALPVLHPRSRVRPFVASLLIAFGMGVLLPDGAAAQDFKRIENRANQAYIHNQSGPVEAGMIQKGWFSAMWAVEPVPNSGYVRFRNRWRGTYLHNQNGPLEAGAIQPGWWSAMWVLEPAQDGYFRIRNRWRNTYIHNQNGRLTVGPVQPGAANAMWALKASSAPVASAVMQGVTAQVKPGAGTPSSLQGQPAKSNQSSDEFARLMASIRTATGVNRNACVRGLSQGGFHGVRWGGFSDILCERIATSNESLACLDTLITQAEAPQRLLASRAVAAYSRFDSCVNREYSGSRDWRAAFEACGSLRPGGSGQLVRPKDNKQNENKVAKCMGDVSTRGSSQLALDVAEAACAHSEIEGVDVQTCLRTTSPLVSAVFERKYGSDVFQAQPMLAMKDHMLARLCTASIKTHNSGMGHGERCFDLGSQSFGPGMTMEQMNSVVEVCKLQEDRLDFIFSSGGQRRPAQAMRDSCVTRAGTDPRTGTLDLAKGWAACRGQRLY